MTLKTLKSQLPLLAIGQSEPPPPPLGKPAALLDRVWTSTCCHVDREQKKPVSGRKGNESDV